MEDRYEFSDQIQRMRPILLQELDINSLLPRLLLRRIITVSERNEIRSSAVPTDVLLDILSTKSRHSFIQFCKCLKEYAPHLLMANVTDTQRGQNDKLSSLKSTNKEKNQLLDDNEKQEGIDIHHRKIEPVGKDTNPDLIISVENVSGKQESSSNFQTDINSMKIKDELLSLETDLVHEETGPNIVWETYYISIHKVPVLGFGIAVSGGYDSPHFTSGDPSIVISDVLEGGPAVGKLQINDRIVTANGISLENVSHSTAINVLKDVGNTINLIIKRRMLHPDPESKSSEFLITLNKKNKTVDFGVVFGCKLFIKEIIHGSLASCEPDLTEGDTVIKINDTLGEDLSLEEAQKFVEGSTDKLQLIVRKERRHIHRENTRKVSVSSFNNCADLQVKDNINTFHPSKQPEADDSMESIASKVKYLVPPGTHLNSLNTRYDGRSVLDNDPASWTTLPRNFECSNYRKLADVKTLSPNYRDDCYSDHEDGWHGHQDFYSPWSLNPRRVIFYKDKQSGLGLRLVGGNATGIFIASVQPGSAGKREGLVEGDKIIMANGRDITGLIREESISYLTRLEGEVTMVIHYRKEEYDRLIASHEAGDSFYIRTHFRHTATDVTTEHSFQIGDIFHVKDTLFRGNAGCWLAIKVSDGAMQGKKGTIPNSKMADVFMSQQREAKNKENFFSKSRGSFFRRKSFARRSKSLGKDHWEEIIFAGLSTKFPAYERVVYKQSGFVRPVIIYGPISDIARERLLTDYPNRFESIQMDMSNDLTEKKIGNSVITLSKIREAATGQKHSLLDITPFSVEGLNYAQCNPIVIFLKAENKQAVKDIRSNWKPSSKNPQKYIEQSDRIETLYSHLFTGLLRHSSTDSWFPKLCEMIESQQRWKIWMAEKQPEEDMNDDLLFPMSSSLSCTTGASSNLDIARPQSELDISPMGKDHWDSKGSASNISRSASQSRNDLMTSNYLKNRTHIDIYATLTPSEKLLSPVQTGTCGEFGPKLKERELSKGKIIQGIDQSNSQAPGHCHYEGRQEYTDNISQSSDSFRKYVNITQNKQENTKLQEKCYMSGQEEWPRCDHISSRYGRNTGHQTAENVDRNKISQLSARYRPHNYTNVTPASHYGLPASSTIPSSQ